MNDLKGAASGRATLNAEGMAAGGTFPAAVASTRSYDGGRGQEV